MSSQPMQENIRQNFSPDPPLHPHEYDVIIIGAGAAGIGMGAALRDLGMTKFVILERHQIGASFLQWPKQMRFISPSFISNGFGQVDLNAVTYTTSPAYTLQQEHPSGVDYAHYLAVVAAHYELPVETNRAIQSVQPIDGDGAWCEPAEAQGFLVETAQGQLSTRFVIWAAGEFQYPNLTPFPGAAHCIHNATVRDWATLAGEEFVVIGGYESGIDAAVNLVRLGKRVRLFDDTAPWALNAPDPSMILSPYTMRRLHEANATGLLELIEVGISSVEPNNNGYLLHGMEGEHIHCTTRPILATGFEGSLSHIAHLLRWHPQQYYALLTTEDESVKTPGLFLSGPFVRHENLIFCFIYKFRQRFAVVANAIGQALGLDTTRLEPYRRYNMYLDDLSCCDEDCQHC